MAINGTRLLRLFEDGRKVELEVLGLGRKVVLEPSPRSSSSQRGSPYSQVIARVVSSPSSSHSRPPKNRTKNQVGGGKQYGGDNSNGGDISEHDDDVDNDDDDDDGRSNGGPFHEVAIEAVFGIYQFLSDAFLAVVVQGEVCVSAFPERSSSSHPSSSVHANKKTFSAAKTSKGATSSSSFSDGDGGGEGGRVVEFRKATKIVVFPLFGHQQQQQQQQKGQQEDEREPQLTPQQESDEGRYVKLLQDAFQAHEFYYSHTHDVTHTFQRLATSTSISMQKDGGGGEDDNKNDDDDDDGSSDCVEDKCIDDDCDDDGDEGGGCGGGGDCGDGKSCGVGKYDVADNGGGNNGSAYGEEEEKKDGRDKDGRNDKGGVGGTRNGKSDRRHHHGPPSSPPRSPLSAPPAPPLPPPPLPPSVASTWRSADERFFWNLDLVGLLIAAGAHEWVTPVMSAYVWFQPGLFACATPFSLLLVSRRARGRVGCRFTVQGLDQDGGELSGAAGISCCANFVETEQAVLFGSGARASYVQVRGSVPCHWSSPCAALKYAPKVQLGGGLVKLERGTVAGNIAVTSEEEEGGRGKDGGGAGVPSAALPSTAELPSSLSAAMSEAAVHQSEDDSFSRHLQSLHAEFREVLLLHLGDKKEGHGRLGMVYQSLVERWVKANDAAAGNDQGDDKTLTNKEKSLGKRVVAAGATATTTTAAAAAGGGGEEEEKDGAHFSSPSPLGAAHGVTMATPQASKKTNETAPAAQPPTTPAAAPVTISPPPFAATPPAVASVTASNAGAAAALKAKSASWSSSSISSFTPASIHHSESEGIIAAAASTNSSPAVDTAKSSSNNATTTTTTGFTASAATTAEDGKGGGEGDGDGGTRRFGVGTAAAAAAAAYSPAVSISRSPPQSRHHPMKHGSPGKKFKQKKSLAFFWFDFYKECSKLKKWHHVSKIFEARGGDLERMGWFSQDPSGRVCRLQRGVCRTSCLDDAGEDRTSLVQCCLARRWLVQVLRSTTNADHAAAASAHASAYQPSSSSSSSFGARASRSPRALSPAAASAHASAYQPSSSSSSSFGPRHSSAASSSSSSSSSFSSSSVGAAASSAGGGKAGGGSVLALPNTRQFAELEDALRRCWAGNSDTLAVLYCGTPASNGDYFTPRKGGGGKRWFLGAKRWFLNNFDDGRKQDSIDLLLGKFVPLRWALDNQRRPNLKAGNLTPFAPLVGQESLASAAVKVVVASVGLFSILSVAPLHSFRSMPLSALFVWACACVAAAALALLAATLKYGTKAGGRLVAHPKLCTKH